MDLLIIKMMKHDLYFIHTEQKEGIHIYTENLCSGGGGQKGKKGNQKPYYELFLMGERATPLIVASLGR